MIKNQHRNINDTSWWSSKLKKTTFDLSWTTTLLMSYKCDDKDPDAHANMLPIFIETWLDRQEHLYAPPPKKKRILVVV